MRVKKYIYATIIMMIAIMFNSCEDYLEKPESAGLTKDVVFSTMEDAEKVLATAYSMPPWGFPTYQFPSPPWSYGMLNYWSTLGDLCEEGEQSDKARNIHANYHDGQLVSSTIYPWREDKWQFEWQAIRSCYLFLENVDQVLEPRPPQEYIDTRKAEAKAFIAQKYFKMFIRYGGMPWIPGYVELGEDIDYTRMSISQTVDSITTLLDIAIPDLPVRHQPGEFGRLNKIAAMGIKAKTLLFSASPLFNPQDNTSFYPSFGQQHLLKHDTYDRNRWKLAADAAKECIDEAHSSGFALVYTGNPREDYRTAVTGFPGMVVNNGTIGATDNAEIIWGTRLTPSYGDHQGSTRVRPYSKTNFKGGKPYVIPLQNLVDKYELTDGSYQQADHYSSSNPYDNLDARFHESILYHNKPLGSYVMNMVPGGDNNPGASLNFTGYYMHKFFQEKSLTIEANVMPDSFWPYMRLSEIYLIYAEALNEYDFSANRAEILYFLNLVRERAGQPNVEDTPQFEDTQEHLRERIRNERAIELAFEEKHYFDLKRWRMGDGYIGGDMHGMRVTGTAANPIFTKVFYENRVFTPKWYLFPIPKFDLERVEELVQNPGW